MGPVNPVAQKQENVKAKAKTAMERLDLMERQLNDVQQSLPRILVAINNTFAQFSKQVEEMREYVDASIGILGVDQVTQAIAENRATRMKEQADATKAEIAKSVEDKKLVVVDKISENSLIVGVETDANGVEMPPGYAAIRFPTLKEEEYKTKLLGQGVGAVLDTKQGGKFIVKEVYDFVPQDPPAAPAQPLAAVPASEQVVDAAPVAPAPAPEAAAPEAPAAPADSSTQQAQ